jgi:hypothetical protein
MRLPPDFKEFLELFNAKSVEYMIVDSYALAYYGAPRYTGDIDVFVNRTENNAKQIIEALKEFGFIFPKLSWTDFVNKIASGRTKDLADIEALGE